MSGVLSPVAVNVSGPLHEYGCRAAAHAHLQVDQRSSCDMGIDVNTSSKHQTMDELRSPRSQTLS